MNAKRNGREPLLVECPNCHAGKLPKKPCGACGYFAGNTTPAAVNAEREIFDLQQKINRYLIAGDTEKVHYLQVRISELQKQTGAIHGVKRGEYDDSTIQR